MKTTPHRVSWRKQAGAGSPTTWVTAMWKRFRWCSAAGSCNWAPLSFWNHGSPWFQITPRGIYSDVTLPSLTLGGAQLHDSAHDFRCPPEAYIAMQPYLTLPYLRWCSAAGRSPWFQIPPRGIYSDVTLPSLTLGGAQLHDSAHDFRCPPEAYIAM